MIETNDIPLLSDMIRTSVDAAARNNGHTRLLGAQVAQEWTGYGPVYVIADGNDPDDPDFGLIPMQAVVGCDNYLSVGTRVMVLYIPPSGGYVIGRPNGASDAWHAIAQSDAVPYGTGWAQYPGFVDARAPSYRRMSGLMVFSGAMYRASDNGADTVLFRLPAQFAPKTTFRIQCRGGGFGIYPVQIDVHSDGTLNYVAGAVGATSSDPSGVGCVLLDTLTFALG